jgi:hypothetical protein
MLSHNDLGTETQDLMRPEIYHYMVFDFITMHYLAVPRISVLHTLWCIGVVASSVKGCMAPKEICCSICPVVHPYHRPWKILSAWISQVELAREIVGDRLLCAAYQILTWRFSLAGFHSCGACLHAFMCRTIERRLYSTIRLSVVRCIHAH